MTEPNIDPTLDLTLERIIRAPRQAVWHAWTDPELFAKWWLPEPYLARVQRLEVTPGGAIVTEMSEDGAMFQPHMDAIFVVVEPERRLVFTNVIDSAWRPSSPQPVAMTAEIIFGEHPDGTEYRAIVRHARPADRDTHETLGFYDGWGAVTAQLAALVEQPS